MGKQAMLFIVNFTDKSNIQHIREKHLEAHISWLDERRDSILVAGSLRNEPSSNPLGGLWVVEANSKNEVSELFETDPFWVNGMREKVEIYHWSKAFPNEKAIV